MFRKPSLISMLFLTFFLSTCCLIFSIQRDVRLAPEASKYALKKSVSRLSGLEFDVEPVLYAPMHLNPSDATSADEDLLNLTSNANSSHVDDENQTIAEIEEEFTTVWNEAMADRTLRQEALHVFQSLASISLQSDVTVLLLIQWCFSAQALIALMTVKIFLGRLSQREFTRMAERGVRFAIFKLVFAGVIIPQLTSDSADVFFWFAFFSFTAYLRIFIGGAKDRLDFVAALPRASVLSQARPLALTFLIVTLVHTVAYQLWKSSSLTLATFTLCGFDLFAVQVEVVRILVRYLVYVYEQRALDSAPDVIEASDPSPVWEGKASFLFYLDFSADLIMQCCGLLYYFQIWSLRGGLRLQVVDMVLFMDVRSILLIVARKIRGLMAYRRITHQINFAFPTKCFSQSKLTDGSNESPEEEEEHTCAICMEKMSSAKVLPCKHLFHLSCLRAMLQQSGPHAFVCPLCRTPLLQQETRDAQARSRQRHRDAREALNHPTLLSSITQFYQSIYLDVAVQVFFGFPVDLEALRLRHAIHQERRLTRLVSEAPIGGNGVATALAGGVIRVVPHSGRQGGRGSTRRRRVGSTEEEVGESEAPPLHMVGEEGEAANNQHRNHQTASSDLEQEDGFGADLNPGPSGPSSARARLGSLRLRRRNLAPNDDGGPSDGGLEGPSQGQGGRGGGGVEEEEELVMMRPPPYDEEEEDSRSIWSVNVSHQVVRSIRSSIAVGIWGGPAAIAGQSHTNDQEAESPLVRH